MGYNSIMEIVKIVAINSANETNEIGRINDSLKVTTTTASSTQIIGSGGNTLTVETITSTTTTKEAALVRQQFSTRYDGYSATLTVKNGLYSIPFSTSTTCKVANKLEIAAAVRPFSLYLGSTANRSIAMAAGDSKVFDNIEFTAARILNSNNNNGTVIARWWGVK